MLKGYQNKAFRLVKKNTDVEKLPKRDGIIYEDDLCLRATALETFVRRQGGFQKWSLGKIVNTLLDYGALCIQEEGTKQVKISKKKGIPRVYRIVLKVLKEKAERY